MIDVSADDLAVLRQFFAAFIPGAEVRAYGSRVKGTAWKFSDLDLAIVTPNGLPPRVLNNLRGALAASDLVFRVDIHDWTHISPEFRAIIEECYEVIQPASA